jgi:putative ABC transport system ATP-binding protein
VFQDFNLLAGLTAVENVSLPLELDGISARKARVAGMAALDGLGLADRAAHFPDELSGGERQRVAIARALANRPRLVLADEPTGNLDDAATHRVLDLLRTLPVQHACTVVTVTHNSAVAAAADRELHIAGGRVVAV